MFEINSDICFKNQEEFATLRGMKDEAQTAIYMTAALEGRRVLATKLSAVRLSARGNTLRRDRMRVELVVVRS